jgi:two-component system nitrogen regulation response regulator NtrX
VRELRNAVERLLILAPGKQINESDVERLLPVAENTVLDPAKPITFDSFLEDAERRFLLDKLRLYGWNVTETAKALDMPRSNLYKRIERYQLTRDDS